MERPGHFQAEKDYFQDDRYKPSLWLVQKKDTRGIYYEKKRECWCIWWYLRRWLNDEIDVFLVGMEISAHVFE